LLKTAREMILSLIGKNLILNKKKILLEVLEHPNVKVPYKCFTQNNLFLFYFDSITATTTVFVAGYWDFSKKGLRKSDFAAILEFFKKCSSMEFLLFLNKQVAEDFFLNINF
jgi:hypothetical protein